jgi:hypothetical protein
MITVTQNRSPAIARGWRGCAVLAAGLLLLGLLGGVPGAKAQGVLAPSSLDLAKLPGEQLLAGLVPQPIAPLLNGMEFHPHLLYRFLYGNDLPTSPSNHVSTIIQEVSPGLLLNFGSHWTLDYTPTLRLYSSRQFSDGLDENAMLKGVTHYEDWTFSLSQSYAQSDAPIYQTEAPTQQTIYSTTLQVDRQLGSQLSTQWSLNQNIQSTSQETLSQDSHEWSLTGGLNDQFWTGLGAGITASAGYDMLSPGSDMEFEELQGTMNFRLGEKFSMTASAGLEVSQLMGSQLVDPVFSGALAYRPWEQTSLSLSASRSVTPSVFENEVQVVTSVTANFHQRFLEHFSFDVSGGYTSTPYVGFATPEAFTRDFQINPPPNEPLATTTVKQSREDDTTFARVSLGSTFRKRGTVSVFYSRNKTTSGLSAYALTTSQVGFEIGWRY